MLQTQPAHVDLSGPLISVVMANYQAGPKIVRALDSVLGQSITNLEVIVSDDASGDDSIALVRQAMQADKRIRLIEAERNGGPARSRNRALEAARGQWIAIVDSDDIIHPERFERLLAAADYFHADVVADDLLHFHEDGAPIRFLLGDEQKYPFAVTPEAWVLAGVQPGTAPLGYLKPMVKASALGSLRYDETLRIGEDYDLLLRVLLSGASLYVIPEPWYLYRRHSNSISHRLSVNDVGSMIDNQQRLSEREGPFPAPLQAALEQRLRGLKRSHAYEKLVAAIKRRDIGGALALVIGDPTLVGRLWASVEDRRRNRAAVSTTVTSPAGPLSLRLGTTFSDSDPIVTREVPAYAPSSETNWELPSHRSVWGELANLGSGMDLKIICDDEAGAYAAGFIPAERIEIIRTSTAQNEPLVAEGVLAR